MAGRIRPKRAKVRGNSAKAQFAAGLADIISETTRLVCRHSEALPLQIIGFVSLAPTITPMVDVPVDVNRPRDPDAGVVLGQIIARMAVDKSCQKTGLGRFLIAYALKLCFWMHQASPCCPVVWVDAMLPVGSKCLIYFLIELASGVVGNIQEVNSRVRGRS
jgi:GNAT superfamily N-acetyltransferase